MTGFYVNIILKLKMSCLLSITYVAIRNLLNVKSHKCILCVLNLNFITATSLRKSVLSLFVIPVALCNKILALCNTYRTF